MTITALLIRLDALEARLDARRRAEAAGQLALDLTGGAPVAGKNPGGGEKCGGSWIDPRETCHKGKGGGTIDPDGHPIDPPDDTRRRRPVEPILFNPPLQGPSGAHLLAYEWQWMMDSFQDSHGEEQLRRVSNWELSEQNDETGRRVVHQFKVRKPDGTTALVSSETAVKILGFATPDQKAGFRQIRSTAQAIARLEMEKAQLEQEHKRIGAVYVEIEKQTPPEPQISRNEYGRGLEWVMPGSDHAIPAKVMPRRVGIAPRAASTPQEAHLMPHEHSTLVSHWQAARVAERLGRSRMPTRGSFNNDMHWQKQELDKRIAKARKRLEQQAAAEAGRADSGLGVDRINNLLTRLDALKRRCSTGYACGSACISVKKECRSQPTATTSRERIGRLEQLAKGEIKPRGIGNPKPEEAQALADKLRTERAEQQAVIKAERARRKAAAAQGGERKPGVKVLLRRAKPGGEMGPDGHWYPGGAWMSEGNFVGAKPQGGAGQLDVGGQKEKPKDGQEQRVVRPKQPRFPERPLKPKGQGLPPPTGLKKIATKNDEEFFGDDGYILYPRRKGKPGLGGTLFEAAVIQRMTTDELQWATEQIRQKIQASGDQELRQWFDDAQANIDDDIARYGGPEQFSQDDRWTARRQLIGVDAERYIAGRRFMMASRLLSGNISQASKRREERYRDPRFEDWIVPEHGEYDRWVWGLNNVFKAVRIRRGAASPKPPKTGDDRPQVPGLSQSLLLSIDAGDVRFDIQQDSRSQARVYAERGYNAKPEKVPTRRDLARRTDLMSTAGGRPIILVRGMISKPGNDYVDMFKNGDQHWVGFGMYGNGTYAAAGSQAHHIAFEYTDLLGYGFAKDKHGPLLNQEANKRVVAFGIKKTARVVQCATMEEFEAFQKETIAQATSMIRAAGNTDGKIADLGLAAAMVGIDAYALPAPSHFRNGNQFWVVLNRGAVVVAEDGQWT